MTLRKSKNARLSFEQIIKQEAVRCGFADYRPDSADVVAMARLYFSTLKDILDDSVDNMAAFARPSLSNDDSAEAPFLEQLAAKDRQIENLTMQIGALTEAIRETATNAKSIQNMLDGEYHEVLKSQRSEVRYWQEKSQADDLELHSLRRQLQESEKRIAEPTLLSRLFYRGRYDTR